MINFYNIKSKLNKAYSQDLLENTKTYNSLYKEYIKTIKSSPILMLEYVIHENLKKNSMNYDESIRFIDENLKTLSNISKKNILEENKKLKKFDIKDIVLEESKINFNNAVFSIINEKIIKKVPNIKKLHESTNFLIKKLTEEINHVENTKSPADINTIFKIAKKKLKEDLVSNNYDDDDISIINAFIKSDKKHLNLVFEDYKTKTKEFLINESENISENVLKQTIDLIDSLTFNENTIINDINKLYELKNINNGN